MATKLTTPTNAPPTGTWAAMTPAEQFDWTARAVLGWMLCDRRAMGWGDGPPVYATGEDPDDPRSSPSFQLSPDFRWTPRYDYLVLQRVREIFLDERGAWFATSLMTLQATAAARFGRGGYGGCFYEPGQYAAAAYAASGGRLQ